MFFIHRPDKHFRAAIFWEWLIHRDPDLWVKHDDDDWVR